MKFSLYVSWLFLNSLSFFPVLLFLRHLSPFLFCFVVWSMAKGERMRERELGEEKGRVNGHPGSVHMCVCCG